MDFLRSLFNILMRALGRTANDMLRDATKGTSRGPRRTTRPTGSSKRSSSRSTSRSSAPSTSGHPSASEAAELASRIAVWDTERLGLPELTYEPHRDNLPDPGEVVWTWVPYEEDDTQGKDRPVLVLARYRSSLIVSQLTSKDHDVDADQEARWGRYWHEVGQGDWDSQHRTSEMRLDRLLVVPMDQVRRIGGKVSQGQFSAAAAALHDFWG
ncbi:type II toxin-antitoxin system PemK/MazF family toxin [Boudabousia liubingyangii]|nr:type II toxin-antitoxin system PemK/MazF family toxin [Boudabousia liubingyangii]